MKYTKTGIAALLLTASMLFACSSGSASDSNDKQTGDTQNTSSSETEAAVREIIAKTGAAGLRDMGAVMAALREQYAGRMDFGQASGVVKTILAQK